MLGDPLGGLVGAVAGAAVVAVVAGVALAWWVHRLVQRELRRGRIWWQRATLRVRAAVAPPGTRREVARLRLELDENLRQTERLLRHRVAAHSLPGALTVLLPRLDMLAADLDERLALWETEPDLALLHEALPALRERVGSLVAQSVRVRSSALRFIDESDSLTRRAAESDLRTQLDGLDAGLEAIRRLDRADGTG
jgi:hypothetical protein